MEKKNNIVVFILLLVIGLLIGAIGMYLYLDNTNNKREDANDTKKESVKKEETEEEDVQVPTDMNKVSEKLNEYFSSHMERIVNDDDKLNTNIIADASSKFSIINSLFMKTNIGTSYNDKQSLCVNVNDYKNKYKEFYGSLDSFDNDTKNVMPGIYYTGDSIGLSSDLACWNSTIGNSGYNASFQASDVSYDKTSKVFTISGTIVYNSKDSSIITPSNYTRNFTLTYVNNGTSNYVTGLILS